MEAASMKAAGAVYWGCFLRISKHMSSTSFTLKEKHEDALIDAHLIISRYEKIKKIEKEIENEKSDAKK